MERNDLCRRMFGRSSVDDDGSVIACSRRLGTFASTSNTDGTRLNPNDCAGVITTVRRDTGEKGTIQIADRKAMASEVQALLDRIQKEMLERSRKMYQDHIKYTSNWDDIVPLLNAKNVIRILHCGDGECAELVKKETAELCKTAEKVDERAPSMGAKALCVPFEQIALPENATCTRPGCGKPAINYTQFGRSY